MLKYNNNYFIPFKYQTMRTKYVIYLIGLAFFLQACFDDKGDYTYSDVNQITIEGIQEEYGLLGNVDSLKISPVVTSSAEGVIQGDNPDYSFVYRAAIKEPGKGEDGKRFVLDSSFTKDVSLFLNILPRKYTCWFTVKDNRTGIETTRAFKLNVGSANSEGWMVLCNEGDQNRVRLDMITVISEDRVVRAFDLLTPLGLPDIKNAVSIGWDPNDMTGDDIYVFSMDGGYRLNAETFQTGEEDNVIYEFGDKKGDCRPLRFGATNWDKFVVTGDCNAYTMDRSVSGAIYQLPVNTTRINSAPEFKVSPYFAVDAIVGYRRNTSVIFYDMTNKRFAVWTEVNKKVIVPLENPAQDQIFDYQTGKELVYMESTQYADGTAYALLKDNDGNYSLYGIAFVFKNFDSEIHQLSYADVVAPDLDKASAFAFHSTLPYMFYAVGNKVYEFDIVTKNTEEVVTLNTSETINFLKFNLFKLDYDSDETPADFLNQQHQLIVGSQDEQISGINNGVLRFYTVPPLQNTLQMKGKPYTGFARIADVVYRERP